MRKRSAIKKSSAEIPPSSRRKQSEKKRNRGYTISEHDPDLVGTQFTFSWGREHIQPVQFNGFDLGPWEVTLTLRPGESIDDLHLRATEYLDAIADREYKHKLPRFLNRIKDAVKQAKDH